MPAAHADAAEDERDHSGEEYEQEPRGLDGVVRIGVGECNDREADRVVSHGKEEKELNGGVSGGEDLRVSANIYGGLPPETSSHHLHYRSDPSSHRKTIGRTSDARPHLTLRSRDHLQPDDI